MIGVRSLGILLVLLSTCLEAFGQISLKISASGGNARTGARLWLAAGIGFFALEAVVWTFVLQRLEVSIAYPMNSLSFVAIALLSRLLLSEKVGGKRWTGVCLILCGTSMVGLG